MEPAIRFEDLVPLLPYLVLGALVLVQMTAVAVRRAHGVVAAITLAGFALAFALLPVADASDVEQVTPLLAVDRYAVFFIGVLLATSAAIVVLSYGYLGQRDVVREEFYILLALSTLGAAVLAGATHFASFFLGIEVLSVALYGLIAYRRRTERDIEAGLKYLVLAGASSGFLLFGMALVYDGLGTMVFAEVAEALLEPDALDAVLATGLALVLVGIGFKLALVPFHMWTPDVYEGAPAPVATLVATVSKAGVFAVVLRFFGLVGVEEHRPVLVVLAVLAVASMLVGNALALLQVNLKRLLAYSSIAHLGYLLVAVMAGGDDALTAGAFYLVTYVAAVLGAFGVLTVLSAPTRDADALEDYRGLFWRRPGLTLVMTVALLSLAGLPVSAGFVGKFLLVSAGAGADLWIPLLALAAGSVIGFFYYLRVLLVMYTAAPEPRALPALAAAPASGAVLGALVVLIAWLGVYPTPLVDVIESFVRLS